MSFEAYGLTQMKIRSNRKVLELFNLEIRAPTEAEQNRIWKAGVSKLLNTIVNRVYIPANTIYF